VIHAEGAAAEAPEVDLENRIRVAVMLTSVDFGGIERVCLTLLKSINRERFDVVPILLTRPWGNENSFVRELRKEGYDVCEIPLALRRKRDYLRIARCYKLVWEALQGRGFHLLHTHGYFADIVGIPIARLISLPSVSTCHGYIPSTWRVRLYNAADRITLRFGTAVLAVSEAIRQDLVGSGVSPGRVRVVANAVDSRETRKMTDVDREAIRRSHGVRGPDFVVGYVGRLSAEKGLKYLLTACAELITFHVPVRVLIIGAGPQRNELERLAQDLGLEDRVVFGGFQEDVLQWLFCMDVFVLPSLTEGTPMALLEAMDCGVPVVASAVGGVPQIVKHNETGILVSPGRADEISRATLALFGDAVVRRRLADNALALVRTHYGIKQWIGRIEAEYERLSRRVASTRLLSS